jgi:flagellar protein FlbD
MIKLTRIDGSKFIINADEIETVESLHDTTISLKTGKKIIVRETDDEIIDLVVDYRQKCNIQKQRLPVVQ